MAGQTWVAARARVLARELAAGLVLGLVLAQGLAVQVDLVSRVACLVSTTMR